MKRLTFGYYRYKGKLYKFVRLVRLKHPTTREWVAAVQYEKSPNTTGDLYVRELREFLNRFEGVKSV